MLLEEHENEAAEAILIAARVLNNYQYGIVRDAQAFRALRRLAQTDEERALPAEKLAFLILDRFMPLFPSKLDSKRAGAD